MSSSSNRPAVLGGEPVVALPLVRWPVVDERDVEAVADVVRRGLFANEEEGVRLPIEEFEEAFAAFQGSKYAVAAMNGTVTIQLLLEALGIGLGDVVFVPGLTWQATAAAVADVNALPWLVDIEDGTWGIDPDALEAAIEEAKRAGFRPRAVWGVHPYNRMADLGRLRTICAKYHLIFLEDCAHAHGAKWAGRGAGTVGQGGSFSYQRSKAQTVGEGGMIVTDDPFLAAVLRSARNCGRAEIVATRGAQVPDWARNWVVPTASPDGAIRVALQSGNYRMTELQAALGTVQLERFQREQQPQRRTTMLELDRMAGSIDGVEPQKHQPEVTEYPQYKWVLKWDAEAWGGLPATAAREILAAELAVEVVGPYDPLTHSPYYRPTSKPARHKLDPKYWELLDPTRYDLPAVERASATGLCFEHTFALDPDAPSQLASALEKVRTHQDALIRWWGERGA
jgi:L-glutamine:2-deoxy-scyllo-inosose/3-amino-2,3-dideoxy-scyllo-inosose aminotransferase